MLKILITGGTGFVMSHVVRQVLELKPGATATVVDAAPLDDSAREFLEPVSERYEVVIGDVGDGSTWNELAEQGDFTHIVHGAAVTSIATKIDSLPDEQARVNHITRSLRTNLMGVCHALGFALSQKSLERFINVSSGSVYGTDTPAAPLPEQGYLLPEGFYASSKYSGELITRGYATQFDMPAISVRLSGVYGPLDRQTQGRDVRCAPYRIAHGARTGEPLKVNSLDAVGDFIHAADVAAAIAGLLFASATRHDVYNIAYGLTTSIGQMLEIAKKKSPGLEVEIKGNGEADIYLDPGLDRGRFGAYDISRVVADTGWRPRHITVAMRDYLDWLENHPF